MALAFTAILAGCALGGSIGGPSLDGKAFLSVAVTDGGVARPLVAGTRIRLDFRAKDASFHAGCNHMGGDYRLDGGRLVFDAVGGTAMACDADLMAQDQWLGEFLSSNPTLTLAGDELTLASGSTVIRLQDREIVEPDIPIAGQTWTLESIISGDAVSSVPQGVVATLSFHADGSVEVETGCNSGSAMWKAVGAGIDVAGLGLTKKACAGPEAAVEGSVVAVLRAGSIVAGIDANVLTLMAGQAGLQYRAR